MQERAVRVVTRASMAEFIYGFCHEHLLLSLRRPRPQGSTLRFSVMLASGTPVFEGIGRVKDVHASRPERAGTALRSRRSSRSTPNHARCTRA